MNGKTPPHTFWYIPELYMPCAVWKCNGPLQLVSESGLKGLLEIESMGFSSFIWFDLCSSFKSSANSSLWNDKWESKEKCNMTSTKIQVKCNKFQTFFWYVGWPHWHAKVSGSSCNRHRMVWYELHLIPGGWCAKDSVKSTTRIKTLHQTPPSHREDGPKM